MSDSFAKASVNILYMTLVVSKNKKKVSSSVVDFYPDPELS